MEDEEPSPTNKPFSIIGMFEFVSQVDHKAQTQTKFYEKANTGQLHMISEEEHSRRQSIAIECQEKMQEKLQEEVQSVREVQFSENLRSSLAAATQRNRSVSQSIQSFDNKMSEEDLEEQGVDWPEYIPGPVAELILRAEEEKKKSIEILGDSRFMNQYDKNSNKQMETSNSQNENTKVETKDNNENSYMIEPTIHTLNQDEMQEATDELSDSGTTINSEDLCFPKKTQALNLGELKKPIPKKEVSVPRQIVTNKQNFENNLHYMNRTVRSITNNHSLQSQSSKSIIDNYSTLSKPTTQTSEQRTKHKIHALIEKRKRKVFKQGTSPLNSSLSQYKPIEEQQNMHQSFYSQYKYQQKSNVKSMHIADYFRSSQDATIRAKTFKDLMLNTLTQRSHFKVGTQPHQTSNKLLFLDQLLERSKGQDVYKRGEALQTGLIDIDKMYKLIIEKQEGSQEVKSSKDKWKVVMTYMENNPSALVDALPVTTQETYEELFTAQNSKGSTLKEAFIPSKKKQRLMQDLENSRQIAPSENGTVHSHYQALLSKIEDKSQKSATPTKQERRKSVSPHTNNFNRKRESKVTHNLQMTRMLSQNSKDSSSQHSSYYYGIRAGKTVRSHRSKQKYQQVQAFKAKTFDWIHSPLIKLINLPEAAQNQYQNESAYFTNEDLDYTLNMVKNNPREFNMHVSSLFTKALSTIEKLCEDLGISELYANISYHYVIRDMKTLVKLMLRCKELIVAKQRMIKILKTIDDREYALSNLRQMVSELDQLDEPALKQPHSYQTKYLSQMSKTISETTDSLVKQILTFLADYHKYFGKVFYYDGTEYLEVARREAKEIADVVDIVSAEDC